MPIQWQTEDGKLFDSTLDAFNHAREAKIRVACREVCFLQPDTSTTLAEFESLVLFFGSILFSLRDVIDWTGKDMLTVYITGLFDGDSC